MMTGMPTRKDETWRYSDLAALQRVWPMRADAAAPRALSLSDGATHEFNVAGRDGLTLKIPAGATVTLMQQVTEADANYARVEIDLGTGARLVHVIQQMAPPAAVTVLETNVTLQENAAYQAVVLNGGSDYARVFIGAVIKGTGADFQVGAVQLGTAEQTLELVTQTDHLVAGCTSTQVVRSVANRRATCTYLGKIEVAADAQKTNASQSSKAMLLARTATINTKPELVIHADDVKCAHGATVGELDKNALFYMAARGVDPAEARALLTEAFIADAFALVDDEALRQTLQTQAAVRLRELLHHA
jgi:Fe-S cluster assembly protein SufD